MEDKKSRREQVLVEKWRYWEHHVQSWRASGPTTRMIVKNYSRNTSIQPH